MYLEEHMQGKLKNKLCAECIVAHTIQVFVWFIDIFYNEITRHIQYKIKKRVLC